MTRYSKFLCFDCRKTWEVEMNFWNPKNENLELRRSLYQQTAKINSYLIHLFHNKPSTTGYYFEAKFAHSQALFRPERHIFTQSVPSSIAHGYCPIRFFLGKLPQLLISLNPISLFVWSCTDLHYEWRILNENSLFFKQNFLICQQNKIRSAHELFPCSPPSL